MDFHFPLMNHNIFWFPVLEGKFILENKRKPGNSFGWLNPKFHAAKNCFDRTIEEDDWHSETKKSDFLFVLISQTASRILSKKNAAS